MTMQDFCRLLIRSRLHTVEAVQKLYRHWQAISQNPESLESFSNWLVVKNYLTAYQVQLLKNGLTDNFFLGPYKILDRVGKGRMAGVYRAVASGTKVVALKVLPPSKARDAELWARFQRETELAIRLSHPNVVRTFDCGKHNNIHYLVMEYLEGETLEAILAQRGKLRPLEATRIAFLTALGLQHITEQGLIHRDLKPANLMLTPAPAAEENTLHSMIKILDIGLARILFDPDSRDARYDITNDDSILGTPDYLAPEQARDPRRVDIRADIYSLGCVLYHALAGEPPFADTNLVRQIMRHATQQLRDLRESNAAVTDQLNRVIMKMLAKNPEERYQSPAQAADALKQVLANLPPPGRC
jgi:eukaryotic-like serine/threonine-protein kinase